MDTNGRDKNKIAWAKERVRTWVIQEASKVRIISLGRMRLKKCGRTTFTNYIIKTQVPLDLEKAYDRKPDEVTWHVLEKEHFHKQPMDDD